MYPQLSFFQSNPKNASPVWPNTMVIVIAEKSEWKETIFIADQVCIFTEQKPCVQLAKSAAGTVEGACVGDGP